jgi:DNA-directed RNA polymerase sigma subunit (sigma70/sigma32)
VEEQELAPRRVLADEAFDPSMNTRFGTYAAHWIKQSIRRALINTGKAIRIPAYVAQMLHELRRVSIESSAARRRWRRWRHDL